MKNTIIIFITLSLLSSLTVIGQTNDVFIKRIDTGQMAPAYTLTNLVNYPKENVKLTDFEGKILILDFWTLGCAGCIESWPKLMELQEKFKDKIQIVLVNVYENQQKVKEFIKRQEKIRNYKMTLPVACGDKQLKGLFPHQLVPHVVFIDQKKRVKYITSSMFFHEETIQNMLDHKPMNIPVKTDEYEKISWFKPLFINGNNPGEERGANLLWSSVITPYSQRLLSIMTMGKYKGTTYGFFGNQPVKTSLQILYGKGVDPRGMVPNARVVFEEVDTTKLVLRVKGIVKSENLYTVQALAKKDFSINQLKKKMIYDLEQFFGIKTYWRKQRKPCLVVSRSSFPIKEFKQGDSVLAVYQNMAYINKVSVTELIDNLTLNSMHYMDYPIVDETNFQGKLGNIAHKTDQNMDYRVLGKLLEKDGLSFSIQEREIDILVITKADQS